MLTQYYRVKMTEVVWSLSSAKPAAQRLGRWRNYRARTTGQRNNSTSVELSESVSLILIMVSQKHGLFTGAKTTCVGYPTKIMSLSIRQPTVDSLHTLRDRWCLICPSPLHDRPLMGPILCKCLTGNHRCQGLKRSLAMSLPEDHVPQYQCYYTPSPLQ